MSLDILKKRYWGMFFSNYTILKLELFPCLQIQFLCTSIPNFLGKEWMQLQVPTAQQDTQKLLSLITALLSTF